MIIPVLATMVLMAISGWVIVQWSLSFEASIVLKTYHGKPCRPAGCAGERVATGVVDDVVRLAAFEGCHAFGD